MHRLLLPVLPLCILWWAAALGLVARLIGAGLQPDVWACACERVLVRCGCCCACAHTCVVVAVLFLSSLRACAPSLLLSS